MAMAGGTLLDNEYFHVTRDSSPCAHADRVDCASRVLIALDDLTLTSDFGHRHRIMERGDIAVFGPDDSHEIPASGSYLEVAIKPTHPGARSPGVQIVPGGNARLFDGDDFFVFEERLQVGETRVRHSHADRLVVQLNRTRLRQWPDGAPEKIVETIPDKPLFAPAVIHAVSNIGTEPLRGIVIEFKPH